jgi:cell division protein FtsI/penicillin-binding protein 2
MTRMSRFRPAVAGSALFLVVGTGLSACTSEPPDAALRAFLSAWSQGNLASRTDLVRLEGDGLPGPEAQAELTAIEGNLTTHRPRFAIRSTKVTDGRATATVTATWPINARVTWSYDTTVNLVRHSGKWRVAFGAATVHPQLHDGDTLAVRQLAAVRGRILDGAGQPIVDNRPTVAVGLEPRRVTDITATVQALHEAFTTAGVVVGLSDVPAQLRSAKPDAFVQIANLRQPDYERIADQLQAISGLRTHTGSTSLAPTPVFARAFLGTAGEVTKEIMDKHPGQYQIGDIVGRSGLQHDYDQRLRGNSGITVVIPKPTGIPDVRLFTAQPQVGGTVTTTLDQRTQNAADAALVGETQRSALVAVRVSGNAIIAVANGPGPAENDFALLGQTPPGSTFKAVTALNVLSSGRVSANTTVPCPQTLAVPGRPPIHNAHNEELGSVAFHVDFAQSCNTAFASLAPDLGDTGLADTARTLGIGVPWALGTDAFTGKVSTGGSAGERAAAAFGQGTTVVSPVVLAAAAAAIARGQWQQPRLVLDPQPPNPAADGPKLDPDALDALRVMMREVVVSGTAKQLKNLSGDLRGKTGTAEYDNNPAHTHSWFMGYRGDIAFCVFVENGGASTEAAVPIAGRFLRALDRR